MIGKFNLFGTKFYYIVIAVLVGLLIDVMIGFYLPKNPLFFKSPEAMESSEKFNVASTLGITQKIVVVNKTEAPKITDLVLTEFKMTGYYITKQTQFIMIEDKRVAYLLDIGMEHKGYKLEEIFPGKARFKKGSINYWLYMDSDDAKEMLAETTKNLDAAKKQELIEKIEFQSAMFDKIRFKDGIYYVPKSILGEFTNLREIFNNISIKPIRNVSGNRFMTYKIMRLNPNSVFARLGLRSGDIITKIDGNTLAGDSDAFKYFNNLLSIQRMKITVMRNNKEEEIGYEIF